MLLQNIMENIQIDLTTMFNSMERDTTITEIKDAIEIYTNVFSVSTLLSFASQNSDKFNFNKYKKALLKKTKQKFTRQNFEFDFIIDDNNISTSFNIKNYNSEELTNVEKLNEIVEKINDPNCVPVYDKGDKEICVICAYQSNDGEYIKFNVKGYSFIDSTKKL